MAKYEVSATLINQLQISLRKEAGLPSFNTSDHPPPSPSILQDAIAAVGSNADALRCSDCRGELLRGSQSIVCIFCGRFQRSFRDFPPVSFKSTLGFQRFLSSLSLDGSECVERPIDGASESGRGQSSVKDEIPLSEFLDLLLKWPDESNRFDVENEHGRRSSRFVGVDFDELFQTEESLEHASSSLNKQVGASENHRIEDVATSSGQSSLSLFENETRSGEGDNVQESDWAAKFQSADSDVKVDYGCHLKLKPGGLEKKDLEKVSISHVISTSDIEPSSGQPVDSNQSERSILVKDDDKGFVPVGDASFDWLPAADRQRTSNKGDPLVDDWDEFRVFTGAEKNQGEPVSTALPGAISSGELDVSDSWNDFTGSVGAGQNQLQNNLDVLKSGHSGGNDNDLWGHTGMEKQEVSVESTRNVTSDQADSLGLWNGTSKEADDSHDLWNDFKSSALRHDNQAQSITAEAADDKWAEGDGILEAQLDFAGLSIRNKEQQSDSSESVAVKNNDSQGDSLALWNHDSLDAWSDFARSNDASDCKTVNNDPVGAWSDASGLITHINQPQSSDTISAENETVAKDDSAFGSWSDFTAPRTQVEDIFSDKINPGKNSENLTSSVEDNNKHNSWSDFGWSTSISEQRSHDGGKESFGNKLTNEDFFGFHSSEKDSFSFPENQVKSAGATFHDGDNRNDEQIDTWTDFTSSSNGQASTSLGTNANAAFDQQVVKHDPFDAWDIIGSASNKPAGKATAVEKGDGDLASGNDKPIDAWTDFTSSSHGQSSSSLGTNANAAFDQQAVKHDLFDAWDVVGSAPTEPAGKATAVEKGNIPEFDLFNTGISQFAGTNSSSHPGQFREMLNDRNGSVQVAISTTEAPDSVRTDTDGKADDSDQLKVSDKVVEESSDLKSPVVENLISEMHDLSFMLQSSLSIPKSGS